MIIIWHTQFFRWFRKKNPSLYFGKHSQKTHSTINHNEPTGLLLMPGLISGSVNTHHFLGFCAFPTVMSATLFTDSQEEDRCIT